MHTHPSAASHFLADAAADAGRPKINNANSKRRSWHAPASFLSPLTTATTQEPHDDLDDDDDDTDSLDIDSPIPTDGPWSAAAAFLSTFTPAADQPADQDSIPGYILGPTIGHGGFSTIKEATSPSGGIVAVKIIRHAAFADLPADARARERSRLTQEARTWGALSHENILPLFDAHRTPDTTYLITLFCAAGSLFDILARDGTLDPTDAGTMFRQVVKGLQYLHDTAHLVHGDIKLENVLVDDSGVCRLADFGLARPIGSTSLDQDDSSPSPSSVSSTSSTATTATTSSSSSSFLRRAKRLTTGLPVHLSLRRKRQPLNRSEPLPSTPSTDTEAPPTHPDHAFLPGSLPYASPELLTPHADPPKAHPAQDMWALGVLLYTLLAGVFPFRDAFEPRLQMKILKGTYDMPPAIGAHAESVLRGCLQHAVSDRWTIAQVHDAAWGIGYGDLSSAPVPAPAPAPEPALVLSSPAPSPPRTPTPEPEAEPIEDEAAAFGEADVWRRERESVFGEDVGLGMRVGLGGLEEDLADRPWASAWGRALSDEVE